MTNRKNKSGMQIAYDTLNNADWRIFILMAGLLLINIGIVPLVERETFNTLRFVALKKFFIHPYIMALVYMSSGLFIVLNLRTRRLSYLVPIGIFLLGYYIFTEFAVSRAYTYGILTVAGSCSFAIFGFIKGGGFIVNKNINELQITDSEVQVIYIAEEAKRALRMANIPEETPE